MYLVGFLLKQISSKMTIFLLKEEYLERPQRKPFVVQCTDLLLEIRRFGIEIIRCFFVSFRLSSEDDAVLSRSGAA